MFHETLRIWIWIQVIDEKVEYKDDDFRFYRELFTAMPMINEYDMVF